jgi:hypothetical protein
MTSRALVSAAGLGAAVIVFAVGAAASSGASARVAHDPCGSHPGAFVASHGLHCGAIFEIPGHHTRMTPEDDAPPPCPPDEGIAGFTSHFSEHTAKWDYWAKEGKWILWDGFLKQNHGLHLGTFFVNRIWPRFHNWGSEAWPVRVHFECKPI